MTYDSNLVGSQYECGVLNAEGALTAFEVDFTFDPNGDSEAWAGDMFMLIQNSHPYGTPEHVCYQYGGYDDTVQGCSIIGNWPTTWDEQTADESFTDYADMSSAELTLTADDTWLVCIGNGWRECQTEVSYEGYVILAGTTTTADPVNSEPTPSPSGDSTNMPVTAPQTAPTPSPSSGGDTYAPTKESVIIEERCNDKAVVEFDTYLVGGANDRDDFPGDGTLTSVDVTMYFGGSTYQSAEWASDMLLFVKMLDNSSCIVMGGFDYNVPDCDFVGYWPSSWETSDAGVYTHTMDVSDHGLSGNNSYTVGIANGYIYGENAVYYQGNVTLDNINYDCYIPYENYMLQNSGPEQEAQMKFDGRFAAREKVCGQLNTDSGQTLKNIVLDPLEFDAQGYGGSWAADMFVTVTSVGGSTEAECVQYGGFDYVEAGCTLYGHWPSDSEGNDWDETDKDGGTSSTPGDYDNVDEAETGAPGGGDVHTAELSNTLWEICIGNGWRESGGVAAYAGNIKLKGLITTERPPTVEPTMAPSGTRSTPTAYPTVAPSAPLNKAPTAPPTGTIENMAMVSGFEDTAKVGFDTFELGGQNHSLFFNASGTLNAIQVNLNFAGAPPDSGEWAADMLLVIYAPDGSGIQIGGFDDNFPGCEYGGAWPSDWDTGNPGTYTHRQELTDIDIKGSGMYEAMVVNGYVYGTQSVGYQGDFTLEGLLDEKPADVPEPDPGSPTAAPTGGAGGDDDTPMTQTAAFIVPIVLLVIGIAGGVAFYFYYNWAVSQGKWKAWSGSSSSWRNKDVKPALTTSILDNQGGGSGGGGNSAYTPPVAPGSMVTNPMGRNRGGPMSKDERL